MAITARQTLMKILHDTLDNRPLQVRLSDAAWQALSSRDQLLAVEMRLLFGCLVTKQVHFPHQPRVVDPSSKALNTLLSVQYRTVATQQCSFDEQNQTGRELVDLPAKRLKSFRPSWLALDYRQGQWLGTFGF